MLEASGTARITFDVEATDGTQVLDRDTIVQELQQVTDVPLFEMINFETAELVPTLEGGETGGRVTGLLQIPVDGTATIAFFETLEQFNQGQGTSTRSSAVTFGVFSLGGMSMGVTIPTNGGDVTPLAAQQPYKDHYHLDIVNHPWPPQVASGETVNIYVLDTVSDLCEVYKTGGFIDEIALVKNREGFEVITVSDEDIPDHGLAVIDVIRRVMLPDPSVHNPSKIKITLLEVMNRRGFGTFASFIEQLDYLQTLINDTDVHLVNMSFVFDLIAGKDYWAEPTIGKSLLRKSLSSIDQVPVALLNELGEVLNIAASTNDVIALATILREQISDGIWSASEVSLFFKVLSELLPHDAPNLKIILEKIMVLIRNDNVRIFAAAGNSKSDMGVPFLPAALLKVYGVSAHDLENVRPPEFPDGHQAGFESNGKVVAPYYTSFGEWSGTSFATPAILAAVARAIHTDQMTLDQATAHVQSLTPLHLQARPIVEAEQQRLEDMNILTREIPSTTAQGG